MKGVWAGEAVAKHVSRFVKANPNGVDVAPDKIFELPDETIFIQGRKRGYIIDSKFVDQAEAKKEIVPDGDGFWNLKKGKLYDLRFPQISIPLTATGFAYPRSTFNRLGILKFQTAVWDSGYVGESSQQVFAFLPAKIHRDEGWIQLVFIDNREISKQAYKGHYQNERH